MQWLIDIAIAAMKAWYADYGGYHDRGEYALADWKLADLTADGAWHTLDASGIVDANTKAIVLRIKAGALEVGKKLRFRYHGSAMLTHTCEVRTQVANLLINGN
ncbi:unnamed protein product, partial [marine sediment metagenome]